MLSKGKSRKAEETTLCEWNKSGSVAERSFKVAASLISERSLLVTSVLKEYVYYHILSLVNKYNGWLGGNECFI